MNLAIFMGRLTREPETRYSADNKPMTRITVAVNRVGASAEADFINCIAFGKQAEFAQVHLHRGTKVVVQGRIQTGSYTNRDGQKVYTTDVVVDRVEFAESKATGGAPTAPKGETAVMTPQAAQIADEGLPWD